MHLPDLPTHCSNRMSRRRTSLRFSILRDPPRHGYPKLDLIHKINQMLAEAETLPEFYERMARSVFILLPKVQFFYLFKTDLETENIHCTYAAQPGSDQPQPFDPAALPGLAGNEVVSAAARLRRPVVMPALYQPAERGGLSPLIQSALAAPVLRRGELLGVLEVLSRRRRVFGSLEANLLALAAGSAGVAIENLGLRRDLAGTQHQLNGAYDAAVEAWRRALELRDRATESHGSRVADMTVRLAVYLGYNSADLTHIRFGAQLHDIGKIGVPDRVLLKPGPFDDEDKRIMRKHPVYAYEMLNSIPNFTPLLDIPYHHHERWDGSGYPDGLQGEQIPLPARIFAVIDVWDALRSDRPYRQAWTEDAVIDYIRDQSGKHFDPRVVQAFLTMGWRSQPALQA